MATETYTIRSIGASKEEVLSQIDAKRSELSDVLGDDTPKVADRAFHITAARSAESTGNPRSMHYQGEHGFTSLETEIRETFGDAYEVVEYGAQEVYQLSAEQFKKVAPSGSGTGKSTYSSEIRP